MQNHNLKTKISSSRPRVGARGRLQPGYSYFNHFWIPAFAGMTIFCLCLSLGCSKTLRTAKPSQPHMYKETFAASPNDIYYALRWALRTYGYPIAEEDLQNGILKSRYVPVKATSHYVSIFARSDYGVNAGYHQLEVRLIPQNGKTEVQVGSRIQSMIARLRSNGTQENLILGKVGDYLRSPNAQLTNLGIQE